jgi:LacI family transcriptional regulator
MLWVSHKKEITAVTSTMEDVARLAGVGRGTVSRVVNGQGSVSPATVARVKKAIAQLDFRPSHAGRVLTNGYSQLIGVYIPVPYGTFYTPILHTINTQLRAAGLQMMVAFGVDGGDMRRQAIEGLDFLSARGCDGLIAMTNQLHEEDLAGLGVMYGRLVVLNDRFDCISEQCFTVDHMEGGRIAARALLELKHRQFAIIGGPSSSADNRERIAGFKDELEQAGIATATLWVAETDFSSEGGFAAASKLLQSGYPFTALFCANDETAAGALSCLQEAGIAIPAAVSVRGYDDTETASYLAPPLTSVHVPWPEVTVSCVNQLINLCYGTHHRVQREFPLSITHRASLAEARGT